MKKKFLLISIIVSAMFLIVVSVILFINDTPYRQSRRLVRNIKEGNYTKVQKLLEDGVDPNYPTSKPSFLDVIVEHSPDVPLAVACDKNDVEIVKLLIQYGANCDYVEGTGWPAIYELLFYYDATDLELVKILLENGADKFQYDVYYKWPVFAAAQMRPTNNLLPYEDRIYEEDIAREITEIVILLSPDEAFDIRGAQDETLLMAAAKAGNLFLVRYLLSKGNSVELRDCWNKSAYDYASENGHTEIAELLSSYR